MEARVYMTASEFSLSPEQRGQLIQMLRRVISRQMQDNWESFEHFELLMCALVAAYKDGMRPEHTGELFVKDWGIDREVMMVALATTAAQVIEVQRKMAERN